MRQPGGAVRAHVGGCRARQSGRGARATHGGRKAPEGHQEGPHGGRHRRPRQALSPRPPGRSARAGMHLRTGFRGNQGGERRPAPHLRPYRHRKGRAGLRRPVLVLLLLQPVQRSARERLGGHADRLQGGHPARSARVGPRRDRALPALGGRDGGLGRGQGSQGGDPSGRLPGCRVPCHVLRLRRLRRERAAGLRPRLRQHDGATAASALTSGADADQPAAGQPVPVVDLRGALGPGGEELQQRAHRPEHQDPMARAVQLDGRPFARPARSSRAASSSGRRSPAPSAARSRLSRA